MDRIVNMALACVWYFSGIVLIVAGYPVTAVAVTIGALLAWRWHAGVMNRRAELPDLPAARLVERSDYSRRS